MVNALKFADDWKRTKIKMSYRPALSQVNMVASAPIYEITLAILSLVQL